MLENLSGAEDVASEKEVPWSRVAAFPDGIPRSKEHRFRAARRIVRVMAMRNCACPATQLVDNLQEDLGVSAKCVFGSSRLDSLLEAIGNSARRFACAAWVGCA